MRCEVWKIGMSELLIVRGWVKFTEQNAREGLDTPCHAWEVTVNDIWGTPNILE